jgi:hypothetical protein
MGQSDAAEIDPFFFHPLEDRGVHQNDANESPLVDFTAYAWSARARLRRLRG